MDDLTWKKRGKCFNTDSTIFFVIRAECANEEEYKKRVERAKAICVDCPVQKECRDYGETQDYGIWGGEAK